MRERPEASGNELAAPVQGPVVQAGSIHGNVHFHAATGSAVPRQLPGATRHFVNRAVELDLLTTMLAGERSGGVVLLSTIDGTAGVGKSTLAVHWAHRVRDRFPDGELYVNLRGFDPIADPMTAGEALGFFLTALNIAPERIPPSDDARAAMFRSVVHGKRMLLLLDNARSVEQVRPLLPGTRTCLVVVTSRDRLDDLAIREGATRLTLKVLSEDESHQLLAHYLGHDRVAEAPGAVAEIVSHCAGLPLALGVVAVRAAEFVDFPLDELAEELRNERERLDALDLGGETGVRAVFSWSYRSLSSEAARLFRLMGLPTGPDIGLDALTALADQTRRDLRRPLAELLRANLIEQPERGRYRFHDLLRAYAAECAATDEPDDTRYAAIRRLIDFYLRTSVAADAQTTGRTRHFTAELPESDVPGRSFDDDGSAIAWWETERHNLRAAIKQAVALDLKEHAWQLPRSLMYLWHLRGYTDDWIEAYNIAIVAAQQLGDRDAQANLLHELGIAHYDRKDFDAAARYAEQSLPHFDAIGDRQGRGEVLIALGHALMDAQRHEEAVAPLENALEIAEILDDGFAQGLVHNGLGLLHAEFGRFDAAFSHFERALRFDREVGEEMGEGFALHNLADAYLRSGQADQAIETHRQALVVRREIGHRQGEAASLRALSRALRSAGEVAEARQALQDALAVFEELGHAEAADVRAELDGLPTP
ncbi:tetratricopeptide repeat protein [Saccharopolyspora sp. NPDC000359]|uniref:ATP-binding protein n=1 Tax=Saccharopolyspora sp. NPDC000359 TaxID=3154251 RepID=UPI00332E5DEF